MKTIFVLAFNSEGSGGFEWRYKIQDLIHFISLNKMIEQVDEHSKWNHKIGIFSLKVDENLSNDEITELVDDYICENTFTY